MGGRSTVMSTTRKYYHLVLIIDLKTDNLDRVFMPRKIVATFDVEHSIHGTTYGPKWWPQIGKYWQNIHCSTCLLLNLIVNYLNTVQIAQIQAYNFECTPCSDAISGPMNRMFDIKSGHDFCRYRNSIQVIYFQINGFNSRVFVKEIVVGICNSCLFLVFHEFKMKYSAGV